MNDTDPHRANNQRDLEPMRLEYWRMRYENTLTHTDSSSIRIYYVDGAVLALVSFVVTNLGVSRPLVLFMALPVAVLALVNYLHSEFIRIQHEWVSYIDARLVEILGEPSFRPPPRPLRPSSAHGVYRAIHIVLAVALLALAVLMVLYGLGDFHELSSSLQLA